MFQKNKNVDILIWNQSFMNNIMHSLFCLFIYFINFIHPLFWTNRLLPNHNSWMKYVKTLVCGAIIIFNSITTKIIQITRLPSSAWSASRPGQKGFQPDQARLKFQNPAWPASLACCLPGACQAAGQASSSDMGCVYYFVVKFNVDWSIEKW